MMKRFSKSGTLIMFYKQRPNKETSWHMSSFDSRCLTVAYFLLKIQNSRCLYFGSQFEKFLAFLSSFRSLANSNIETNKKALAGS